MTHRFLSARTSLLAVAFLATLLASAQAAPLMVDSFAAPRAPHADAKVGLRESFFRDFDASMLGGVREASYSVYLNPKQSVAALAVGKGQVSVAAGTGALGELVLRWGAFTRPSGDPDVAGPLLGQDLSGRHTLEISFSGVEYGLNVVATLYTANPTTTDVYYTTTGVNTAPATPGEPLTVRLKFDPANGFNYAQMDGVVLLVDRSGNSPQNSYVMTQARFVDD